MNFLPFVFTFLLVLTLISSFLFSSVMGTARESRVILSQHKAYLTLLSNQNEKLFKSKKVKTENPSKNPEKKKDPNEKDKTAKKEDKEPRSVTDGCDASKLNLFDMIHGNDPQVKHTLEQTAIRLIEILYGPYIFYNSAPTKDIAHTIVQQMMHNEIESLEELQFENEELNQIYYKMLKGTNTGYPSLSEYFYLNTKNAPIYFQYATKPVIRAVLGDTFANTVFDLEKQRWQKNKLCKALIKEKFVELAKTHHASLVPFNLIKNIFNFEKAKKGVLQIHQEEKIRAVHKTAGEI